jgi:mannosyltransferase
MLNEAQTGGESLASSKTGFERCQFSLTPFFKLSIILALAALLRFLGLGVKQFWLDEIMQVLHSRPDTFRGILDAVALDWGGAPLDYLVQHLFIANVSGSIEWTARLHAALFGVLSVLLIYLVCRELMSNERLALLSALLFCFYPFHHYYSQEGRPYSLFVFITLILYFLFFRSLKRNRLLLWGCFCAVAILGFYTHVYTAFVLFAQFISLMYYSICHKEDRAIALRRCLGLLSCSIAAAVAYLPWLLYSFSSAKGDSDPEISFRMFMETIKRLGDGSYLLSAVLIVCAAIGIHHLSRTQRRFELGILLIWIIAPLPAIFALLMWRTYVFVPRQILFITPAFFILVAAGIDYLKQRVNRRYFLPEAIVILISIVCIALHYPDKWNDIRGAAQFLKATTHPSDVIIAPKLSAYMSLYFPEIFQHTANNCSTEDFLRASPHGCRIFYVTLLQYNPDADRMNNLFADMPKNDVHFRGINISVFLNPSLPLDPSTGK